MKCLSCSVSAMCEVILTVCILLSFTSFKMHKFLLVDAKYQLLHPTFFLFRQVLPEFLESYTIK